MGDLFIPIALAVAGVFLAAMAYSGIRRGGARFYTLEREAVLRRASFSLLGSVLLLLASVSLLIYERQQQTALDAAAAGEQVDGVVTVAPTSVIEIRPPEVTPSPTVEVATPTATPVICKALIEGTSGNGLTLRDAPGGAEVSILPEGNLVTVLPDEPQDANGLVWRKVRTVFGDEGWVASDFLTLGNNCGE